MEVEVSKIHILRPNKCTDMVQRGFAVREDRKMVSLKKTRAHGREMLF
jgi:hypothetical protein